MTRVSFVVAAMALAAVACSGGDSAEVDASSARADAQPQDRADAAPPPDAGVEADASDDDDSEACSTDSAEPNDDTPHDLGEFTDSPRTTEVFDAFGFHDADDVDLYIIDVLDGGDGNNPDILVELRDIPAGHDYVLEVQFECGGENQETSVKCDQGITKNPGGCVSDEPDNGDEAVKLGIDCSRTISDDGEAIIRISSKSWTEACEPYELSIDVD